MSGIKGKRTHRVSVGLNEEEYRKFQKAFSFTKCRTLSDYGRKRLLRLPVIRQIHNESVDALTEELTLLRTALEDARKSLSETVETAMTQKGRAPTDAGITLQIERQVLANKITEIKFWIRKIAEKCSQ